MAPNRLPVDLRGSWIWEERGRGHIESYVLFRRNFMLDEIPSSADLWFAARSFCHVYVNGTHLCYGLATCPVDGSYVWYLDIAYLLGTGVNTIAILGYNTKVARTSCRCQPSGLWCQLDVDDAPVVWTDPSWKLVSAAAYAPCRPRRSQASGFTEKVDLRRLPEGWTEREFSAEDWSSPDYCVPVSEAHWNLLPFPAPEIRVGSVPFNRLAAAGSFEKRLFSTNVSFEKLVAQQGGGVYAAETYIHASEAEKVEFELYTDNPYRLYVNDALVKEQGVRRVEVGESFHACHSPGFRQGAIVAPEGKLEFREGWNRVVLFQELEPGSTGATLLFPEIDGQTVHLQREPDKDSMPGWLIAGRLRTPLANVLGNLDLSRTISQQNYIPVDDTPVDEGAELMAYTFAAEEGSEWQAGEPLTLRQGEYAILALESCKFGCPMFTVSGSDGDILDIASGTEVENGQLLPWDNRQENVDTIVLAENEREWMACAPRGIRFMMLVARSVNGTVTITEPRVKIREFQFEHPGSFESADQTLNTIWRIGRRTLEATVQEAFIDSPCKEETQYIADAMIQSWASYHTFGNFGLAAKSLEEFSMAQFETGEMPAACPSDIYFNIPDYAMLWTVWLQRHYMYTGDSHLLERLLPNVRSLFSYFAHVTLPGQAVLGDLENRANGYCFLDHSNLDRRGIVTGLNALYCRALLNGAFLLQEGGEAEEAAELRARGDRVAVEMRRLAWDADKGLFADGWHNGPSESHTLITNVLAVYGGIARTEDYGRIMDAIFLDGPPFVRDPEAILDNPYFKYFILETAFALGRRQWALDYLRWYWSSMVERGAQTWWEIHNPIENTESAVIHNTCNGYGTSPNGFLISELAGIRPAKPGFTTAYFNPLVGDVRSVKAKVPTPYGQIMVEWEQKEGGQLEVVIDANYPLSVIPELEPGISESATIHVSDEVTIYASE
ncbi:MAG: hypothetical protein K9N51_02730 [Candidatus Pacebacteria bacterium]|nr:hypothetical protein [Candidatus Paceibacterota bacterium]